MGAPCAQCGKAATCHCRCGVWYCSRGCQTVAWTGGHRRDCKRLSKARKLAAALARETPEATPEDDEARCPGCRGAWDPNESRCFETCCARNVCRACAERGPACPLCAAPPEPGHAAALARVRAAVDANNCAAMCFLAQCYRSGALGVAASPETAAELLQRAADLGDPAAMARLADLCRTGDGVAPNATKAAELLRCAADKGDALAQFNLGSRFFAGDGVDRDEAEAHRLYAAAAAQGLTSAEFALGALYAVGGDSVAQDLAAARSWYARAAAKGDEDAQANLDRLPSP